jgi:hypothetical protein
MDVPVDSWSINSGRSGALRGPVAQVQYGGGSMELDEALLYDRALNAGDRAKVGLEGDMVRVPVSGSRTFGSILNYSVEETDFGRVKVNATRYHAFVFTNSGSGSVATGTVSVPQDMFRCVKTVLPGDYYDGCYEDPSCGDATCQFSMWPDSNVSVLVEFNPLERGIHTGAIEFSTLLNVSVPIQGTGYLPIEWIEGN